jgi:hypothetical protein
LIPLVEKHPTALDKGELASTYSTLIPFPFLRIEAVRFVGACSVPLDWAASLVCHA